MSPFERLFQDANPALQEKRSGALLREGGVGRRESPRDLIALIPRVRRGLLRGTRASFGVVGHVHGDGGSALGVHGSRLRLTRFLRNRAYVVPQRLKQWSVVHRLNPTGATVG